MGNDKPTRKRFRRTIDRFDRSGASSVVNTTISGSAEAIREPELTESSSAAAFSARMAASRDAARLKRQRGTARLNAAKSVVSAATALDTCALHEQATAEKLQVLHGISMAAAKRMAAENARRPVYQARVAIRDGERVDTVPIDSLDDRHAAEVGIDTLEFTSDMYLDTLEQRLAAIGAAGTTTINKPRDKLQPQRRAACVQLNDRAVDGWGRGEERSQVWIEYLSTDDFAQGLDVGGPWFGQSLAMAWEELAKDWAKSFHTRGVKVAMKTRDKFHADAVSIELGWSTFAGGSQLQMQARRNGTAYERRSTAAARGRNLGNLAEMAAPVAWDFVRRRWPQLADEMWREVGIYGIFGTAFSKVTIAYDNPTCLHYDSNFGADVIMCFKLATLQGGEHVMMSVDGGEAVVVETSELGVLIGGCHEHLLHGNCATTDGGRVVLAFYFPQALRKEAPNRFA